MSEEEVRHELMMPNEEGAHRVFADAISITVLFPLRPDPISFPLPSKLGSALFFV